MPHPLPLVRRAPCEAARDAIRPERGHRAADGARRPVQERCGHHRPAAVPHHHAARPLPAPAAAPQPSGLWQEMMGRWLSGRE